MIFERKSDKNLQQKKFRKGDVIFREGEFEILMYAINSGTVKIIKDYGKDSQTVLTTLYDGDTFGEMGLIDSMPRSATAIAAEKTIVTMIDNVGFGQYFKDKPAKIVRILQHLSTRIRNLTDEYMDACITISQYMDAQEKGEELSDALVNKMKEYGNKFKK